LAEICEPRCEEILSLVDQELVRSGYKNMIAAGVVLTGGTSLVDGMQELAEQIFDLPVRIGYPAGVGGLKDVVSSPKYATAVGLLMYGAEKKAALSRSSESVTKMFSTAFWAGCANGSLTSHKKMYRH
ncbi:hypothetical protein ADUPG1_001640, partial [Aduncisulcus paluster]